MMGHGQMLMDTSPPNSPLDIIYRQVDRVLVCRIAGRGASEAMDGLMACIEPWKEKDKLWDAEMKAIRDGLVQGDAFWEAVKATIRFLSRLNLWAATPRHVEAGKEMMQSV